MYASVCGFGVGGVVVYDTMYAAQLVPASTTIVVLVGLLCLDLDWRNGINQDDEHSVSKWRSSRETSCRLVFSWEYGCWRLAIGYNWQDCGLSACDHVAVKKFLSTWAHAMSWGWYHRKYTTSVHSMALWCQNSIIFRCRPINWWETIITLRQLTRVVRGTWNSTGLFTMISTSMRWSRPSMSQDLDTSCNGYLSIETLGPFLEKLIGADEESHQKKSMSSTKTAAAVLLKTSFLFL